MGGGYTIATVLIGSYMATDASQLIALSCKLFRSICAGPIAAIGFFIIFVNVKIDYSKSINSIAESVLGVYLLHDSNFTRNLIWKNIFKIDGAIYQSYFFPIYSFFCIVLILLLGIMVDCFRRKVIEPRWILLENYLARYLGLAN